jgi:hypothetical protein
MTTSTQISAAETGPAHQLSRAFFRLAERDSGDRAFCPAALLSDMKSLLIPMGIVALSDASRSVIIAHSGLFLPVLFG